MTSPSPSGDKQVRDKKVWAGYALSGLAVFGLGASAVMKLMHSDGVIAGFTQFGYPTALLTNIGILELVCIALYVIPRTSVLGALFVTAYLGGAVATHVRVGDPFASPIVVAVLFWGGLWLRSARLRALVPLTSAEE